MNRKKDYFPKLAKAVKGTFDDRTNLGNNVAVNVIMSPDGDFIKTMDGLIFHTVGMAQRDLPEIVIYLGPRLNENAIPVDDALDISTNILNTINTQSIAELTSKMPATFITKGNSPRRFMRAPAPPEMINFLKYGKLAQLTAYYNDCNYDVLLYEPSPWLH